MQIFKDNLINFNSNVGKTKKGTNSSIPIFEYVPIWTGKNIEPDRTFLLSGNLYISLQPAQLKRFP